MIESSGSGCAWWTFVLPGVTSKADTEAVCAPAAQQLGSPESGALW